MKVARDKAFERLCKLEDEKVSGRLAFIITALGRAS